MKILITGASGAVGRHLCRNLAENASNTVFAATSTPPRTAIPARANLQVLPNEALEGLLATQPIDCLVHCAFPRNVDPKSWASGIRFGYDVLFLARQYGVKSVIHLSSQSLYGLDREKPSLETDAVSLVNPYGTGKYCTEELVNRLFAEIPHTNIRLSTLIGAESEDKVPNKFLRNCMQGGTIQITGGRQVFSFLDIRDCAEALAVLVASDKKNWRQTYNLGTAEYATLPEIAETAYKVVRAHQQTETEVAVTPAEVYMNNRIDCTAFSEDFGWCAKYTLADSLEYIYRIYAENKE